MNKGALCRALNTHAWDLFGAIVILRDDRRRVTLLCRRCETVRQDTWDMRGIIVTRGYRHGEDYATFIKSHDRAGARADILLTTKAVMAPQLKEPNVDQKNIGVRQARGNRASNRNVPAKQRAKPHEPSEG
jgi:hypothetical protein